MNSEREATRAWSHPNGSSAATPTRRRRPSAIATALLGALAWTMLQPVISPSAVMASPSKSPAGLATTYASHTLRFPVHVGSAETEQTFTAYELAPGIAFADRMGSPRNSTWRTEKEWDTRLSEQFLRDALTDVSLLIARIRQIPTGRNLLESIPDLQIDRSAGSRWLTADGDVSGIRVVIFPARGMTFQAVPLPVTQPSTDGTSVAILFSLDSLPGWFTQTGSVQLARPELVLAHELHHAAQMLAGADINVPFEMEVPVRRHRVDGGRAGMGAESVDIFELLTNGGPIGRQVVGFGVARPPHHQKAIGPLDAEIARAGKNPFVDRAVKAAVKWAEGTAHSPPARAVVAARAGLLERPPTDIKLGAEWGIPARPEYLRDVIVRGDDVEGMVEYSLREGVRFQDLVASDFDSSGGSEKITRVPFDPDAC